MRKGGRKEGRKGRKEGREGGERRKLSALLHARSDPIRSFTAATDAGKYYWAGKIAESARMGNGRMGVASDLEEGGRVCTAAAAANGLFRPSKNNGRSKERERERTITIPILSQSLPNVSAVTKCGHGGMAVKYKSR